MNKLCCVYLSAVWMDGVGRSLECCFLHVHRPGLALEGAEDPPLLLHLTMHTGAGGGPPPPSPLAAGGGPPPPSPLAVEVGLAHHYTPIAGEKGSACVCMQISQCQSKLS